MRHRNPASSSCHNLCSSPANAPYYMQYVDSYRKSRFKKTACSKRRYVQIIQYVANHDGCKRVDILHDVYKQDVKAKDCFYKNKLACRGYASSILSQLLYIDVIDYDKSFRYHVTDRGLEVLKFAFQNDVMGKCSFQA